MSNNITKKLYENIYRALGGDPNVQFETADDIWNAVTDIYDEGYDPIELSTLEMTITENGVHEVDAPNNDGYNKVKVEVAVENTGAALDFTQYGYNEADSAAATTFITDMIDTLAVYPTDGTSNWEIEKGEMLFGPKITVNFTDGFSSPDIFSNETNLIYVPAPEVINMTRTSVMFQGCTALKKVPLFDTSNVTDMDYMFNQCKSLKKVPVYNTSNVTNMSNIFSECINLREFPALDYNKVQMLDAAFAGCQNLSTYPENLDFSSAITTGFMFNNCSGLGLDTTTWTNFAIPDFTTSEALFDTNNMFNGCTGMINAPMFETCNVTNMNSMFSGCTSLQSVPHYNTGNVQNMNDFLNGCAMITTVPQFDTHSVMQADSMFTNCSALTSIPELNFSNIQWVGTYILWDDSHLLSGTGYPQLTDLGGFVGFGSNESVNNLFLAHCTALTYDSIMNVINKVADRATLGLGTGTLHLPHHAQSLLTETDIMIAISKGWTVNFEPEWVNPRG